MNIYFACSITAGREFEPVYQALVAALSADGHEIPTAHLAGNNVLALEAVVDAAEVYARDVAWIRACQALIAEVSVPSHGVGYEIGFALNEGKPVLCLYQQGRKVSKMITGNPHRRLKVAAYRHGEEAIALARQFLAQLNL
ncbi:MAG: nucleoside 2-deoxyribosyltransferase [Anaerolineae bacterium]